MAEKNKNNKDSQKGQVTPKKYIIKNNKLQSTFNLRKFKTYSEVDCFKRIPY